MAELADQLTCERGVARADRALALFGFVRVLVPTLGRAAALELVIDLLGFGQAFLHRQRVAHAARQEEYRNIRKTE